MELISSAFFIQENCVFLLPGLLSVIRQKAIISFSNIRRGGQNPIHDTDQNRKRAWK